MWIVLIVYLILSINISFVQEMVEAAGEEEQELAEEMAKAFLNENLPEDVFGAPKAGPGMWASLIRIMSPISGKTLEKVSLPQNEAAYRWVACLFEDSQIF